MPENPLVVTVSELRRRLAALLYEVETHRRPLFVTQHGLVTAVLLSREEYVARDQEQERERPRRKQAVSRDPMASRFPPKHGWEPLVDESVWTEYGRCDLETAQVLAAQGVETELVCTDEGWLPDDEG